MTRVHVSNDLKKVVSKYLNEEEVSDDFDNKRLGKWNATLFYKNRGKYLLLINAKTKFSFIIPNVKVVELEGFTTFFCKNLCQQLRFEEIPVNYDILVRWIKDVTFFKTDNDRKSIGVLTYILSKIKNGKTEFYDFEKLSMNDISSRLNLVPYKELNWKNPKEKMKELINKSV